jgi:hypothetical protein
MPSQKDRYWFGLVWQALMYLLKLVFEGEKNGNSNSKTERKIEG